MPVCSLLTRDSQLASSRGPAYGRTTLRFRPEWHMSSAGVVSEAMTDAGTTAGAVVVHAAAHGRLAATVGGTLWLGDDAARTGASTAAAFRADGALLAVAADPKTLLVLAASVEGAMRTLLWMYVVTLPRSGLSMMFCDITT